MALIVVETVGSASANSFVSVAEADAYVETRLNSSAWTGDDAKKKAVIEATREISALTGWIGNRVDDTQALSWPRQGAVNPDSPNCSLFETNEIPQAVKDATSELAFQFLKAGTSDVAAIDPNQNVQEKTVDVLTTVYFEPSQRTTGFARFPRVMQLLGPLFEGVTGAVRLVR